MLLNYKVKLNMKLIDAITDLSESLWAPCKKKMK